MSSQEATNAAIMGLLEEIKGKLDRLDTRVQALERGTPAATAAENSLERRIHQIQRTRTDGTHHAGISSVTGEVVQNFDAIGYDLENE